MGLRISCLVHSLALLICGCAARKPVVLHNDAVFSGRSFVASVDAKMPEWDADVDFAQYERAEIATVKADIATATTVDSVDEFLKYVTKLHKDGDSLVELDERLRREVWL